MARMSDRPSSVHVFYIAARPEKIWAALTEGDWTARYFFGRRWESDWKTGSPWVMRMDDGRIDSKGTVLESRPPNFLSLSWKVEWLEELRKLPEGRVTYAIDKVGEAS